MHKGGSGHQDRVAALKLCCICYQPREIVRVVTRFIIERRKVLAFGFCAGCESLEGENAGHGPEPVIHGSSLSGRNIFPVSFDAGEVGAYGENRNKYRRSKSASGGR